MRCSAPTVFADLNRTESPYLKGVSPTETCTEHATAFDFHRVRHKDRFPFLLLNLESLSKSLKKYISAINLKNQSYPANVMQQMS